MKSHDLNEALRKMRQQQRVRIEGPLNIVNWRPLEQLFGTEPSNVVDATATVLEDDTAKVEAMNQTVEQMQQFVEQVGPPPPRRVKLNARMVEKLRTIVPAASSSLQAGDLPITPPGGIEIEIDDTVPDGVMQIGGDLHSTKRETAGNG